MMMKGLILLCFVSIFVQCCGGNKVEEEKISPNWKITPDVLSFPDKEGTREISITSSADWAVRSDRPWCTVDPGYARKGEAKISVSVSQNLAETPRKATLSLVSGKYSATVEVRQEGAVIPDYVPEGYRRVFADEFNESRLPGGKTPLPDGTRWYYETGGNGWGNHELQNYVPGFRGADTCAVISDGTLKIRAVQVGNEVLSIRMNSKESWLYGYFEARLRMPSGGGTWPAFWMLPKDFKSWPLDGEIDIMEYVGYDPNTVHCTIHTDAYNHAVGTQKGASIRVERAEQEFHIYAVEWTAETIRGFVDGREYFRFVNDGKGDKRTWPFDVPFYLKLNLAWGGNWGGQQGTDTSQLPATYEIDYVRVYRKE